jgi:hypothetical protein
MKFTPGSDLVPEGQHDAVVMSAIDKKSTKGNEMIEMQIAVYVGEVEYCVTDWLVDIPSMQYKLRHFCESAGFDYDKGELDAEKVQGCNVRVNVTTNDDEKYGKQSRVRDYLPKATVVSVKAVVDDDLDGLPF